MQRRHENEALIFTRSCERPGLPKSVNYWMRLVRIKMHQSLCSLLFQMSPHQKAIQIFCMTDMSIVGLVKGQEILKYETENVWNINFSKNTNQQHFPEQLYRLGMSMIWQIAVARPLSSANLTRFPIFNDISK